jgi:dihydroxyacetone kinase
MSTSHFINEADNVVRDAISGLLLCSAGKLAVIDEFPTVVVRNDWEADRVALISGGGSGHEPSHAGLVGEGLLTAAVCGDLFASPTVHEVLAAIRRVASREHGAVLIVKSYTGDRLNFALAMERARLMGFPVEMIVVEDDVALPDVSRARGIAGTLFVHKICGYLAQQREPLARIVAVGRAVAASARSMGVALSSCSVPGRPSDNRIRDGFMEVGMGIHGEKGASTQPVENVDAIVAAIATRLLEGRESRARFACILNNLGGTSVLEMSIVAAALVRSPLSPYIDLLVGPASLMTSFAMHGFSISILPLDDTRTLALTAPVAAAAWSVAREVKFLCPMVSLEVMPYRSATLSSNAAMERAIRAVCDRLVACEAELNELDRKCGDGDTGTAIATGCRAVLCDLGIMDLANTANTFETISESLSRQAGGSIGVLGSIFFAACAKALHNDLPLVDALIDGHERLSQCGGARVGDRTLLDALVPALQALRGGASLQQAAAAAQAGADSTAKIARARAGRSEYVGELTGIADPGAVAIAAAFKAVADAAEQ